MRCCESRAPCKSDPFEAALFNVTVGKSATLLHRHRRYDADHGGNVDLASASYLRRPRVACQLWLSPRCRRSLKPPQCLIIRPSRGLCVKRLAGVATREENHLDTGALPSNTLTCFIKQGKHWSESTHAVQKNEIKVGGRGCGHDDSASHIVDID